MVKGYNRIIKHENSILFNTLVKKQVYFFGCGDDATSFLERYPDFLMYLCGFIDTYKSNYNWNGVPVIDPKDVDWKNEQLFVVISTRKYFDEIEKQIISFGLNQQNYISLDQLEFKLSIEPNGRILDLVKAREAGYEIEDVLDYIEENSNNRKTLLIFANCQCRNMYKILMANKMVMERYLPIVFPPIHEAIEYVDWLYVLIDKIDLFIYQHVNKNNRFSEYFETDLLVEKLKKNARSVCFPNVYWNGYFIQYNPHARLKQIKSGQYPFTADILIQKMADEGYGALEITDKLCDEEYLSKDAVIQNKKRCTDELIIREKKCNVIISDFIEKHYRSERLFYIGNHPSNFLLAELLQRIFYFLHEEYAFKPDAVAEYDYIISPIYASVRKHLELEWRETSIRYYSSICQTPVTFYDYVNEYLKYI